MSRSREAADTSHRRTNSAPTPHIDIEDVSNPLTSAEEISIPEDEPFRRRKYITGATFLDGLLMGIEQRHSEPEPQTGNTTRSIR